MLKIQDSHGANAMQLRKPEEVLCSAVGEHAVGVGEPREHSNLAGILKPDAGRHDCRMIRLLAVSQPRTPARERKPREARGAAAMEVGAGGVAVLGRL